MGLASREPAGLPIYVKCIEPGVIQTEYHLGFLQQADCRKGIGSVYDGPAVILIESGVHIYPQISNVRRQRRVHEECDRGSVEDKWDKWRWARTEEGSKSLLIQLGDYGLWLMLGNLKENFLRERESIRAV